MPPDPSRKASVVVVVIQGKAAPAVALHDALAIEFGVAVLWNLCRLLPRLGSGGWRAPAPDRWRGGALRRRPAHSCGLRSSGHRVLLMSIEFDPSGSRSRAVDIGQENADLVAATRHRAVHAAVRRTAASLICVTSAARDLRSPENRAGVRHTPPLAERNC